MHCGGAGCDAFTIVTTSVTPISSDTVKLKLPPPPPLTKAMLMDSLTEDESLGATEDRSGVIVTDSVPVAVSLTAMKATLLTRDSDTFSATVDESKIENTCAAAASTDSVTVDESLTLML